MHVPVAAPDPLDDVRRDYAGAVARLQRIVKLLSQTQVTDAGGVKTCVNVARQELMTIVNCADPAVIEQFLPREKS